MKHAIRALCLFLAIAPGIADAQQFPTTLPPQTVVGRLGTTSGPAQAVPITQLIPNVIPNPLPGSRGGTNNQFMQFTGPSGVIKTYALPNANGTIATLADPQVFTNKTFSGGSVQNAAVTGLPAPSVASDAATKSYVDGIATGLVIMPPSRLATAAVLPNTPTYSNGTAGVGATLTAGSNSTLTVDGTVAALNDVVLVKNQASSFQNGVYTVTTAGSGAAAWVLTRATYFDQSTETKAGAYTLITAGSVNSGSSFVLAVSAVTIGTDAITFNTFANGSTGVTNIASVTGAIALDGTLRMSGSTLGLATIAANTVLSNWTGSTAVPSANAYPSCSDSGGNHLNYVAGTGITCGTSSSVSATCPVTTYTVNTSLSAAACQVALVDCTSGVVTITLFAAGSGTNGDQVFVKKIDSSANNAKIVVSGGANIDGGTTIFIASQWTTVPLVPNNSQWYSL